MSEKTQLAVKESRISHWADVLSRKASSGMSVETFCLETGITRNQYFYWLRKVREAALDLPGSPFVELKVPAKETHMTFPKEAAMSISIADATIFVNETTSQALLVNVIRAIRDA